MREKLNKQDFVNKIKNMYTLAAKAALDQTH